MAKWSDESPDNVFSSLQLAGPATGAEEWGSITVTAVQTQLMPATAVSPLSLQHC